MKKSLYLGRFKGIKVYIHWSFLILIFIILYSGISSGQSSEAIVWHLLFILSIFACVIFHEFGHALTGRHFGYNTKDITLLPIGGLARFEKLPEKPREELLVAIAGPLVNFIIALILFMAIRPTTHYILDLDLSVITPENFLIMLLMANLTLGLFNLIPAFPMDGGRILRAILALFQPRAKATKQAAFVGLILALGFIFIGIFYNPFLVFIGAFVILAAFSESTMVGDQALLSGHQVGDIVMHHYASLPEQMSIGEASMVILDGQDTNFVVESNGGEITGTLKRDQIIKALSMHEHTKPLSAIMDKVGLVIHVETPLTDLYTNQVLRQNIMVPVSDGQQVVGVINLENILEFLAIKKATPFWKQLFEKSGPVA
ncbi:site-2 protease family protein [Roseivirga sp.]|uniref:site-2 protease family protein n=1 Tax=Roseivirga sp. TaxID=1964215 RepID=UPI003B526673